MLKFNVLRLVTILSLVVLLLSACSAGTVKTKNPVVGAEEVKTEVIPAHEGLNQEPIPLEMERDGKDVYIKMTTQITDIEIEPGNIYKAWTFNGEAPGPLIVVEEGDTLHFEIENIDPAIPNSIDLHAVHTNPDIGFADIEPNETGTFSFPTSSPGVFMYHCATDPVLSHIANGMHGVIIVKPADGFPTDNEIDRKSVV